MRRHKRRGGGPFLLGLFICAASASCDSSLPAAPDDFHGGVIIYEHPAYQGASGYFFKDLSSLTSLEGPCEEYVGGSTTYSDTAKTWNDCMSSIRVAPGWRATLYVDGGFNDDRLEVTEDISDLRSVVGPCRDGGGGFNDCVSSIRVHRPLTP